MSKKPETVFREKAQKILKTIPHSKWFSIQQKSIKGTPDTLGVIKGKFIALEWKMSATARRDPLQEFHIQQINQAGGLGLFVYPENWETVLENLEDISLFM